jgi:hypothetical protein
LSLPIEIRLKVYELVLAKGDGISAQKALHLLLSCRQISVEVAQVLCENGGIRISADQNESVSDTLNIMGAQNRSFIRRLEIDWTDGTWGSGVRGVGQLVEEVCGRTHTPPPWLRVVVQSFLAEYNADVINSLQLVASCSSLRDLTLVFPWPRYEESYDVGFCLGDHFLLHPEIRQALAAIKGVSILTVGYTVKFKEILTLAEEMGVKETLEVVWMRGGVFGSGESLMKQVNALRKEGWKFDIDAFSFDHWDMAWKKMCG